LLSDRLDAKYAEFNENTRELDRWVSVNVQFDLHYDLADSEKLIETLFSPIQNAETEVKNG
jgi:hypothetical protein